MSFTVYPVTVANANTPFTTSLVDADPGPNVVEINEYTFELDFTSTPTMVVTGDIDGGDNFANAGQPDGANTVGYTASTDAPEPGSFDIDVATGQFTYTVSLADLNGDTTASFNILSYQESASQGGTILTFNLTPCFAAGTRIATPAGERRVEDLAPGDSVLTADGRSVAVTWIGRKTVTPMFNPADRLNPVRIRMNAIALGVPRRDLVVTADHGIIIDGLVIDAGALVNGTTIDWYPWRQIGCSLTYHHVETRAHDVILANNVPAETYIDYAGRRAFDNYDEYLALHGAPAAIQEMARPRISAARFVPAAIRERLGARLRDAG